MSKQAEIREGVLHDFLFEGQHCVTFTIISGDTVNQSFRCFPTKLKAIRGISLFKHDTAWRALADE